MSDISYQTSAADTSTSAANTCQLLKLYQNNEIDKLKEYIEISKTENTLDTQDLIDLAKSDKDAATLVKELINTIHVDETELADKIAKEIIHDIEDYVDTHLEKYHKYALNAPQVTSNVDNVSKAKFFNLISLLKDVSILGRKLLEASPRFESFKPKSPQISDLNLMDKKFILAGNLQKDSKSQMSEDDATSDDLLAALIESSSSDDFLVLSSSLDSISVRDMILASLTLITSHECFTLSHDIQGVVMVLRRTKFLIKNILAPKNQMELVTKLLTSISRYNEMKYVFDLFRDRNQFEMLLSKGVEKTPELRIALFNYVKKNPEFYALVTLNFSMFREIAESLEASAEKRLDKMIQSRKGKKKKASTPATVGGSCDSTYNLTASIVGGENKQHHLSIDGNERELSTSSSFNKSNSIAASLSNFTGGSSANTNTHPHDGASKPLYSKDSLNLCLVEMVDASDCFAKAGCYKRSISCEHKAKLIALQLALLSSAINVLDLQQSELSEVIVGFESFPDAFIVAEAHNYHLAWRQALFRNVLLLGQLSYLDDFCMKCDLSQALIIELVFLYKQYVTNLNNQLSNDEVTKLASSMKLILARLSDVELKCKLYNQLSFNDSKEELLRNPSIHAHLKDFKLA